MKNVFHINHLNAELNPICRLLTLLGAHPIFHISRIRVNYCYTFRRKLHNYALVQGNSCAI
jgi:hypothetical protein